MNNVLLVATTSWAGMGPYASEIINSFNENDNVYFFLVEDERFFYSQNILLNQKKRGIILFRKNSRINKLTDLFYPSRYVRNELVKFCQQKQISTIHFLTSEVPYYKEIVYLQKKYNVFFTVHDLYPHEAKKSYHKLLRQKIIYKKLHKIRNAVNNLITNSETQYNLLKSLYPQKNIYYHEFPSLINKSIIEGSMIPHELIGISNYVLFFGRIELYKGIDSIYDIFCNDSSLNNTKLVIAGSGDIYFKRNPHKEKNIIFINRYIKDEEVSYLFTNAIITVYPYLSATQSGVLSLSTYFGKPILASDLPYFQIVESKGLGFNFTTNDKESLSQKLKQLLSINLNQISQNQKEFYLSNFSKLSLRNNLLKIYNK